MLIINPDVYDLLTRYGYKPSEMTEEDFKKAIDAIGEMITEEARRKLRKLNG